MGDAKRRLAPDDPRIAWQGAISLEIAAGTVRPWRLPHEDLDLFSSDLYEKAAEPAGVRIAFRTDSSSVSLIGNAAADAAPIDCCCDGVLAGTLPLEGRAHFDELPADDKLVELWLPQRGAVAIDGIELDGGSTCTPFADTRPRWITYGSSITQCRMVPSPTATWPAIVARREGLDLTCLGFAGQCHLDPMVARLIRDRPADLVSMCVGINIYGQSSFDRRTLRPAISGFMATVRDGHPDIPFVVISPIWSPSRERAANAAGMTLEDVRDEVAAAVELSRDDATVYVDGRELLGKDAEDRLPDGLHPDADGYRMIAKEFRPFGFRSADASIEVAK